MGKKRKLDGSESYRIQAAVSAVIAVPLKSFTSTILSSASAMLLLPAFFFTMEISPSKIMKKCSPRYHTITIRSVKSSREAHGGV